MALITTNLRVKYQRSCRKNKREYFTFSLRGMHKTCLTTKKNSIRSTTTTAAGRTKQQNQPTTVHTNIFIQIDQLSQQSMATSVLDSSPRPSPFSMMKPDPPPALQTAFSSIYKSSNDWAVNMNSGDAGISSQNVAFTKDQFQVLCDKQRKDFTVKQRAGGCVGGGIRSPSQVIEMSFGSKKEYNEELANEVNEWVEFLPYGDGKTMLHKDENPLSLCKWIFTTRSQDQFGHWKYVDREPTTEEIMSFKEKGFPYYR